MSVHSVASSMSTSMRQRDAAHNTLVLVVDKSITSGMKHYNVVLSVMSADVAQNIAAVVVPAEGADATALPAAAELLQAVM